MNDQSFHGRTLRPMPALLKYYLLCSLLLGHGFLIAFPYHWFRYKSLRYELDEEGISMRWGVLFRREIHLAYDRLQDIHLNSNAIERRLGLAKVKLQTASGSSGAEITVEGVDEFEALRDYLYSRMRGARAESEDVGESPDEVVSVLREVVEELRELRQDLRQRSRPEVS